MNINRAKVREFLSDHDWVSLYLGNKIIQSQRKDKNYFDISTDKEIFGKILDCGQIFSLTDVSNFHNLHRLEFFGENTVNTLDEDGIIVKYNNLQLLNPMQKDAYYVTHLQPLWLYGVDCTDVEQILDFLSVYNNKNRPRIETKIIADKLQITDWWYTGGECMSEDDYIDIVSTYEENLSKTLGVVYDGGYPASKCMRKSFGKR